LIEVVDYDTAWPQRFEQLRATVWPAVSDIAIAIEHVGSTSVPGLAAKPIIDVDAIVLTSPSSMKTVIASLTRIGYEHQGDLGVPGREAFRNGPPDLPPHHLYSCIEDCVALRNHLVVRDFLRAHPDVAREYGELKKRLARGFPDDIDSYIAGKTDLLCRILALSGMPAGEIAAVRGANIGLQS